MESGRPRGRTLWSNMLTDQLANAVKGSGLVRTREEAYILIIPALASEDLLPETDDSLKAEDSNARPGEKQSSILVSIYGPARRRYLNGFNCHLTPRTSRRSWIYRHP